MAAGVCDEPSFRPVRQRTPAARAVLMSYHTPGPDIRLPDVGMTHRLRNGSQVAPLSSAARARRTSAVGTLAGYLSSHREFVAAQGASAAWRISTHGLQRGCGQGCIRSASVASAEPSAGRSVRHRIFETFLSVYAALVLGSLFADLWACAMRDATPVPSMNFPTSLKPPLRPAAAFAVVSVWCGSGHKRPV